MKNDSDLALSVTHEMLDQLRPHTTPELLSLIAAASALLRSRRISTDQIAKALRAGEAAVAPVDRRKRKGTPSGTDVVPVPKEEK